MSVFDRAVLAERTMAVERHLRRVAERLPAAASAMQPATDVSDVVILHLWQATQLVIDLAMAACLSLSLGTPASYADAFRRLQEAKVIESTLADRLVRQAGFRDVVAHAYGHAGHGTRVQHSAGRACGSARVSRRAARPRSSERLEPTEETPPWPSFDS